MTEAAYWVTEVSDNQDTMAKASPSPFLSLQKPTVLFD
jgi:hypothetical protein